jgi:type III pantothenate kinase
VIDIGNTRVKAAVFQDDEIVCRESFDSQEALISSGIKDRYQITDSILGTVVDDYKKIATWLESSNLFVFSSQTPVPLKNLYRSAHSLGSDRLAAAVGGWSLAPGTEILVIDAGTCIKYNFVNSSGEYLGGAISPGLKMRFRAMHTFTDRLPLLSADEKYNQLIGTTSAESIIAGAQDGAAHEIDGFISEYRNSWPGLKVFLTGGDTEFFAGRLKNPIFADQNLILRGLHRILVHNLNV